jgi:hypothetical protein
VQSLRKTRDRSGLAGPDFPVFWLKARVKGEGPAFGRACFFFLSTFNSTELSETKMPVLADLFFGWQVFYFELIMVFAAWVLRRFGA